MENLLKNDFETALWHYFFEENLYYSKRVGFLVGCFVGDRQQQKMLTKEFLSKIGSNEPISNAFTSLLDVNAISVVDIKNKIWSEEMGHWSEALSVLHLLSRKVSGETQSDYNKTLLNIQIFSNISDARIKDSSKDFLEFCRLLSNWSGNDCLDKEVCDSLKWKKIGMLTKESHDSLMDNFLDSLFNTHNYNNYEGVVEAIKDVYNEEPDGFMVNYPFFNFLINEFVPELEKTLLNKTICIPSTKKIICKI